jgi:hypothetical protein
MASGHRSPDTLKKGLYLLVNLGYLYTEVEITTRECMIIDL